MPCRSNEPAFAITKARVVAMKHSTGLNRLAAVAAVGVAIAAAEVLRRYFRGPVRTTPPVPEERPHEVHFGKVEGKHHGDGELITPPVVKTDPYFWMRDDDRKHPQVIKHLNEENAYTNYMTLGVQRFAKKVYKEMLSHFQETDSTVPAKDGKYAYYAKTIAGRSYKYYCRKKVMPDGLGDEEMLLDVNQLAKGLKHCDIGSTAVSPDDKILAYSIDDSGYETYQIRFKDLATGELLENDTVSGTSGSIEWGKDEHSVYYSTHDDAHRPWKLWRHDMRYDNTEPTQDQCLYTESDTEFYLHYGKSRSQRFLFIDSSASTLSETRFIDLENTDAGVQLVRARQAGVMYSVRHARGNMFYVVTNAGGATNFKLMRTTVEGCDQWEDLIPYDEKRKIDGVAPFANFAVVAGRLNGYSEMWMLPDHDPAKIYMLEMEEAAHDVGPSVNHEYETNKFRYMYSSLTTPKRVYDFDVATRKSTLLKETHVPLYNRDLYKTERLEAVSEDGVKIPISLVYNEKAIAKTGPNKIHLYGYGSYEISIDPSFAMSRLPLLDRGVMYAIAHVRGGGEYGRSWYEAAKFETKIKTFQDFCACAEKLIDDKRTTPDMLSMEGRSAGGLLMGAVMNMRPELFKAVIAGVPFVDVMNTMSDPSIPLTTGEWQEWGNPHEQKFFDAIGEYCPYSNVGAKPYPATLILAGLYDPRVLYSEPAKWAAKLRKMSTSGEPILLKVDMSSGHFSASNRYTYLKQRSFELAWLLRQLEAPDGPIAQ